MACTPGLVVLLAVVLAVRAQLPPVPIVPEDVPARCADLNDMFHQVTALGAVCPDGHCPVGCGAAVMPLVSQCGSVLARQLPVETWRAVSTTSDLCNRTLTTVSATGQIPSTIARVRRASCMHAHVRQCVSEQLLCLFDDHRFKSSHC
jgi:hypothetical protein